MSEEKIKLQRVWQSLTEALTQEIVEFWLAQGAVRDREVALQRVTQVVFVARSESGELVAVNTAYQRHHEQLDLSFYYVRAFVAEPARRSQLAVVMLRRLQSFFDELFQMGALSPAVGLFLEVENPVIKKFRNEAIWPTTKFVYVGQNARGDHQRVYYFDDARIGSDA